MSDIIIFRIEIKKCYGGFAAASNFITKIENRQSLCAEELRGITSLRQNPAELDAKKIVSAVYNNSEKFLKISKPEKLQEGIRNRVLVYCFLIDEQELNDIIELQYYYLIKCYFSECSISALLQGTKDFYYKASHYFMDVNFDDNNFYNSVYFEFDYKLNRMQKINIDKINPTDFVPLQHITENTLKNLQKKTEQFLEKQELTAHLLNDKNKVEINASAAVRGCLKILEKNSRIFRAVDINRLVKELMEGSLLSFILFSYSISDFIKSKSNTLNEQLLDIYRQAKECTICCQQLIENAVMHSTSGMGVITIRFHSQKSEYPAQRYGSRARKVPYLEILITDYAGICSAGNLAENFKNKIQDKQIKESFGQLQPIDFLIKEGETDERRNEIIHAFAEYYSHSENIGRNFGLRIFSQIIQKNLGTFSFYSHENHQIKAGETWGFSENSIHNQHAQCMPGTAYSVLFPLDRQDSQITRAKVSIDENIQLEKNINYYMGAYSCFDQTFLDISFSYFSQAEKEECIRKLADCFISNILGSEEEQKIAYVSAENVETEFAEYLCKALLIAGYREKIPDYVFYNCSKGFVETFQQCMNTYFGLGTMWYAYENRKFAIALFTKEPVEETIIIPSSISQTLIANKMCGFAGGGITGIDWLASEQSVYDLEKQEDFLIPPYDILHEVCINDQKRTIFEHYALQVLETDIQERAFGCKISDTHMRLGSTIHINCFYEAELLFSNRLFISRFSYLLVKNIKEDEEFKQSKSITLYSYALYSELLIFETMSLLVELYPEKDFDYAILEREAEHRDCSHTDRIRYSKDFERGMKNKNEIERKRGEYFKNRKIICIVPINSTLKTHEKLIDLFCRDNCGFSAENIILNYAIVLVGSKLENKYWKIDEKKRVFTDIKLQIKPIPRYFVEVKVDYQEALGCKMCFPDNALAEIPLIEVNAASTIPNQAFGLYKEGKNEKIDFAFIEEEEEKLRALKNSLIYSHIQRGENHFSFYFKTDRMFIENKEAIKEWLKEIGDKLKIDNREYHILVCPSHFSNAGFLEYINKIIFHEAAITIRVDVDKEYRCNMEAKYSSIEMFLEMLSARGLQKQIVKTYFIDDSIITGRTFYRAKSLISSIMGLYSKKYENVEAVVFDKIFVLLDRNSYQTKMQYLDRKKDGILLHENLKEDFFAYRSLSISSLRNHGDSCVICQLEHQADILYQASATQFMAAHWKNEKQQFSIKYLGDKQEEELLGEKVYTDIQGTKILKKDTDRPFRRMVCMHVASIALSDENQQNKKSQALRCILEMLLEDYNNRKKSSQAEAFEYFLSYVKVISRPFLVFSKPIHEAVFDILLILSEYILSNNKMEKIIKSMEIEKPYVYENRKALLKIKTLIIDDLKDESQKKDLLLVLIKQLTELRSNYFIRPENIRRLADYISKFDDMLQRDMYKWYLWLVKKLVGLSSDTSKSAWMGGMLCSEQSGKDKLGLNDDVYTIMVLENTRAYLDGLEKLCKDLKFSEDAVAFLGKSTDMEKKKMSVIPELQQLINSELQKFQYRDFNEIINNYNLVNGEGLDEQDIISLAAGMELFKLANQAKENNVQKNEDKKTWEQCYRIVCLMERILQAQSVKLVLELPLECDVWETEISEAYNNLVRTYAANEKNDLMFEHDPKKEYLIFADSSKGTEEADRLSVDTVKILKDYRKSSSQFNKGFHIDKNGSYIIWEIGQEEVHPVIIYIEFGEKNFIEILNLFRNVLCMYFYVNKYIFNSEKSSHLYELILAEREALVYNSKKLESHTAAAIKNRQYEDVQCEERKKESYFRSYVLTLLADLQISDVYRPSLRRGYYGRNLNIRAGGWDITALKLHDETTFYIAGTGNYDYIELKVVMNQVLFDKDSLIDENDYLIGYKIADGIRETFLMVLALIMNATVVGRAAVTKHADAKLGNAYDNIAEVTVYITKTEDGNLRIANKCRESLRLDSDEVEQINSGLDYPPGKNQGISLWSMSRYIKGIISILLKNSLERLKQKLHGMSKAECAKELEIQKSILTDLLSDRFRVKVGLKSLNGERYFYTSIPVLNEKYHKYKDIF